MMLSRTWTLRSNPSNIWLNVLFILKWTPVDFVTDHDMGTPYQGGAHLNPKTNFHANSRIYFVRFDLGREGGIYISPLHSSLYKQISCLSASQNHTGKLGLYLSKQMITLLGCWLPPPTPITWPVRHVLLYHIHVFCGFPDKRFYSTDHITHLER